MTRNSKNKPGFTFIELALSLVGIGVLTFSIALTIINIYNSYNLQLSIKSVSQASRSLVADLQTEIRTSQAFDPVLQNSHFKAIPNTSNPSGGRLCLGTYSYIWNYGDSLYSGTVGNNSFSDSTDKIKLIKISDQDRNYCSDPDLQPKKNDGLELLNSFDRPVVLYDFKITSPDSNIDASTGRRSYYIEFTLGTNNPSTINLSTNKCKQPNEAGSDLGICVSKLFSVTILSGGSI